MGYFKLYYPFVIIYVYVISIYIAALTKDLFLLIVPLIAHAASHIFYITVTRWLYTKK